jgi:glutamine synthetase
MAMCDTYLPDCKTPHMDNTRFYAERIFAKKPEEEPMFGIEQEYFLINPLTKIPIGFPKYGLPPPQG